MRRTSTTTEALTTGTVVIDVGDNLTVELPLGKREYVIDQSVGRVVKVWDYINNRYQIIFGDTGVRAVDPLAGFAGTVHMVRVGRQVDVFVYDLTGPIGTANFVNAPAGFRSRYRFLPYDRGLLFTSPAEGEPVIRRMGYFGDAIRVYWLSEGESLSGHFQYFTDDPWPTSLPGTAVGGITA